MMTYWSKPGSIMDGAGRMNIFSGGYEGPLGQEAMPQTMVDILNAAGRDYDEAIRGWEQWCGMRFRRSYNL